MHKAHHTQTSATRTTKASPSPVSHFSPRDIYTYITSTSACNILDGSLDGLDSLRLSTPPPLSLPYPSPLPTLPHFPVPLQQSLPPSSPLTPPTSPPKPRTTRPQDPVPHNKNRTDKNVRSQTPPRYIDTKRGPQSTGPRSHLQPSPLPPGLSPLLGSSPAPRRPTPYGPRTIDTTRLHRHTPTGPTKSKKENKCKKYQHAKFTTPPSPHTQPRSPTPVPQRANPSQTTPRAPS